MNVEKRESGDEEILVARLDSRSKQLVASFSSFFFFFFTSGRSHLWQRSAQILRLPSLSLFEFLIFHLIHSFLARVINATLFSNFD